MARKRQSAAEAGGSSNDWMTTYCDLVTLLFAFFVLLFAISQVDEGRFDTFVLSMQGATVEEIHEFGMMHNLFAIDDIAYPDMFVDIEAGESDFNPALLQEAYDSISEYIMASGMGDDIFAYLGEDYIFIRFMDDMLFAPNSAIIIPHNYPLLNLIGVSLRAVENDVGMIRIDGHTATVPGQEGTYHISDRVLSGDRANAILQYFEDVVGIRGDRLSALAFGRFRPIAENDTEEGRRQNRRIEIMVTEADMVALQLDVIYERMVE